MAEVCMGVFHWPPESFWNASLYDVVRAVVGYKKANGLYRPARKLSEQDITDLRALLAKDKRGEINGS